MTKITERSRDEELASGRLTKVIEHEEVDGVNDDVKAILSSAMRADEASQIHPRDEGQENTSFYSNGLDAID